MAPVLRQVVPADPPLLVDGHTPFVARTPVLLDARGNPVEGRTVEVALVANTDGPPIHPTLSGFAVPVGGGVFTRAFTPRALSLHLADYAGRPVYLRSAPLGDVPTLTRYRVVWQLDLFPVPGTS